LPLKRGGVRGKSWVGRSLKKERRSDLQDVVQPVDWRAEGKKEKWMNTRKRTREKLLLSERKKRRYVPVNQYNLNTGKG